MSVSTCGGASPYSDPVTCRCGESFRDKDEWLRHRGREVVRIVAFSFPVVAEDALIECLLAHDPGNRGSRA